MFPFVDILFWEQYAISGRTECNWTFGLQQSCEFSVERNLSSLSVAQDLCAPRNQKHYGDYEDIPERIQRKTGQRKARHCQGLLPAAQIEISFRRFRIEAMNAIPQTNIRRMTQ